MSRSTNIHRGEWTDTSATALSQALGEVGLTLGEFVQLDYADGPGRLEPIDPNMFSINVEIIYSEPRQQYKAILRREDA
jgi:hypothetical protein